METVPHDHLEVELAEPGVVGQARLCGREVLGLLHAHQVLRLHDAPLQQGSAAVGAVREINDAGGVPVAVPELLGGGCCRRVIQGGEGLLGKADAEFPVARIRGQDQPVGAGLRQGGVAAPTDGHIVGCVIDGPFQQGPVGVLRDDRGAVPVVGAPVGAVVAVLSGRIGEAQHDGQRPGAFDAGGEHVFALTGADGRDRHGQVLPAERRMQHTVPHVQGLVYGGNLLREHPVETDVAQVHAVRILPDPGGGVLAALRQGVALLHRIDAVRVARQRVVFEGLGLGVAFGVGEGMPGPLAVGAQRQAVLAVFREGLQAGGVQGQGEGAVAEVEGMEGRERVDVGIVTLHERMAVDALRAASGTQAREQQEDGSP